MAKDKTGVRLLGVEAIHPLTGKNIPIFISDYVLISYGTGAIMAVPAHDTRDFEFAKKFDLPVVEVVAGGDVSKEAFTDCATGTMVNSGFLNGMTVEEAKAAILTHLEEKGVGAEKGKLQAARLGFLPPEILGRADPDRCIVRSAAPSPCRRASCPCGCRWSIPTSRPTRASRRWLP